jgi:hypothetical protein
MTDVFPHRGLAVREAHLVPVDMQETALVDLGAAQTALIKIFFGHIETFTFGWYRSDMPE